MFTGLIEELGVIAAVQEGPDSKEFLITAPLVTQDAQLGDSIAVNGVCLTVTSITDLTFGVFVMAESLARSALGDLQVGDQVNLERAMPVNGRFGGHIVQGHVDGVGVISNRRLGDRWEILQLSLPQELRRYLVEKGSITVDGISLTVAKILDSEIELCLIPKTLESTTLGKAKIGKKVNLEVDVLAKYVENILTLGAQNPIKIG